MKKLFFFRSSTSNNSNAPPPATKQYHWENTLDSGLSGQVVEEDDYNLHSSRGLFSKSRKHNLENQNLSANLGLQRSRSLSTFSPVNWPGENSFAFSGDQNRSPSPITSARHQQYNYSFPSTSATSERQRRAKKSETAAKKNARALDRPVSPGSSKFHHDLSRSSSYCSSTSSSKVIDRYIDGEQHQERSRTKNSSQKNNSQNESFGGRLPPRMQYTAPSSPTGILNNRPKSYSFREDKGTHLRFSSEEWVENGFGHDSPRRLAKNVVERLSQTHACSMSNLKQSDQDIPITIEDVYGGLMKRHLDSNVNILTQPYGALDVPYRAVKNCGEESFAGGPKQNHFYEGNLGSLNSSKPEDLDVELQRRFNEAEERAMLLSEELERESFFEDHRFDVPFLIETIRHLTEEKVNLSLEVSGLLQSRISERAIFKEELCRTKTELESRTIKVEKEKNELQMSLEKELDRRSNDWSLKVEKYQVEEQRLRERVRELAEQNVSLQREVSSFNERETENRSMAACLEQQLKELNEKVELLSDANCELQKNFTELQEKYRVAEGDAHCIKRNFEEKERECRELHRSVSRLLRTCNEQEKTIEGLREGYGEEIEKKQLEKFDKRVVKLQMEQMRLAGVELALRRELESYRLETDSLRQENISILNRLKANGNDVAAAFAFRLDQEIWNRVSCLQNQGLTMLDESTQLCGKLLDMLKRKAYQLENMQQVIDGIDMAVDGQFLIGSDMKVQGFKMGTESLRRSLHTVSTLLQEKSDALGQKSQSDYMHGNVSENLNVRQASDEFVRAELKTETLLTSLLREKLYAKEQELEQLQAELAAAVRGNDILKCEVQNAMDNISCLSHRCKDLELQMLKKDENVNRIQNDLQESTKELTILRGILPKVSEQRDLMWEKVKQCSESNMLLNSEVEMLKKKIETLDEDILLKEGQITILKDTIGNKDFNLLGSHDSTPEFFFE